MVLRRHQLAVALAVALIGLLSATLTFAARNPLQRSNRRAAPATPKPLLVPDVRGKAYVFAEGMLEEAGFAWQVAGPTRGYAANTVSTQTPEPGVRVVDTGAPTVTLVLARNPRYAERGTPLQTAGYRGTALRLADAPAAAPAPVAPAAVPQATRSRPDDRAGAVERPSRVAHPTKAAARAVTRPGATRTRRHDVRKKATPAVKPARSVGRARTPDFVRPGAPKEPLDEIVLPARAQRLHAWVLQHPRPTPANVRHWLYQHEWIVTGASFGWWHGAEALEVLIRVDQDVQRRWSIGARSERAARTALSEVRARSR
jgi:hypothetical protein